MLRCLNVLLNHVACQLSCPKNPPAGLEDDHCSQRDHGVHVDRACNGRSTRSCRWMVSEVNPPFAMTQRRSSQVLSLVLLLFLSMLHHHHRRHHHALPHHHAVPSQTSPASANNDHNLPRRLATSTFLIQCMFCFEMLTLSSKFSLTELSIAFSWL